MTDLPAATYRLQFHRDFTFRDACGLAPYLARLGISHLYASPIFRAAPGSTHGYDVSDHNELNPELGTREDFDALSAALRAHGLGLIADFVPNHMGIDRALNPWWRDVLENGPASPYARFFDIDWHPLKRELKNKVLLPVLGEQYGHVLESNGFVVEFRDGDFLLRQGELTLPLDVRTTLPLLRQVVESMAEAPLELQSIVTAIDHLPTRDDTAPDHVAERLRERQVVRERLARLCMENSSVGEAITAVLDRFHDSADAGRFDRLDELINAQAYRLSSWRVASEEINYRRFFDVNTLAALRMELPEVFEATHRLLLSLIAEGHVSGVRIDHIDGLAAPREYLQRLRERGGEQLFLLVEKILGPEEKLRPDWPVHGTTGYEFANDLVQLLVAPAGVAETAALYERFLGFRLDYREVAYRSKTLVMQSSMSSELNVLGHLLNRISESQRWYRDFTVNSLTAAVREVIACFPVYRTYLDPAQPPDESDIRVIDRTLRMARRRNRAVERTIFDFVRHVLLPPADNPHPVDEELRRLFVLKFQQCTGPIAAKGVEDTAFYVFNRLVALNEVGGEPASPGLTLEAFHRRNAARQAEWPHCMLATSTHDTKHSEDVRARIAALSEMPEEWGRAVRRWHTMNRQHRAEVDGEAAPDANEEYLYYQTLLGAWPLEGLTDGNRAVFAQRIKDYMMKALREAKVNSSWLEPHGAWENAVMAFVDGTLKITGRSRFPQAMEKFVEGPAQLGALNSLTQVILKTTSPGVPDFYQGAELWDLSLVDPDNRRPVDYALRQQQLEALEGADVGELLERWKDGRLKLFVIQRLLRLRREERRVFQEGSYEALAAAGSQADKVVAFSRRAGGCSIVVVVPRHTAALGFPPLGEAWGDTSLSPGGAAATWQDVFTGARHSGDSLPLSALFARLPFAVLRGED